MLPVSNTIISLMNSHDVQSLSRNGRIQFQFHAKHGNFIGVSTFPLAVIGQNLYHQILAVDENLPILKTYFSLFFLCLVVVFVFAFCLAVFIRF